MPELLAFGAFVIAWVVIEAVYIARKQPTISEHIRSLAAYYPPFGRLVMLLVGLFLGHWFWQ